VVGDRGRHVATSTSAAGCQLGNSVHSSIGGQRPSFLLPPVGVRLPGHGAVRSSSSSISPEPNRLQLLPPFAVPSALFQPASHQILSMLQHRQFAVAPDETPWSARHGAGEPNRMFLMRRGEWDRVVADTRLRPWSTGAPFEPAHPHLLPYGAAPSGAMILRSPSAGYIMTDCFGNGPAALNVPELRWGLREAVAAAANRSAMPLSQAALSSSLTETATSSAFAAGRFGLASSHTGEAGPGRASSTHAARHGKSAREPDRGGTATTHVPQPTAALAIGPCRSIPMSSREADAKYASRYQCLLREQIEYFEADAADLRAKAQGRNVPIRPRQVGIRCVHCARRNPGGGESSPSNREGTDPRPSVKLVKLERESAMSTRGAVYYPTTLSNLYQAVQNMANNHFVNRTCSNAPSSLIDEILEARRTRPKRSGGKGKQYFVQSAEGLGIADASEGPGIYLVAGALPGKAVAAHPASSAATKTQQVDGQGTANAGPS
jgi:hypothetical protein